MPDYKFSDDKTDRWISRIRKRSDKLSADQLKLFNSITGSRARGEKLTPMQSKVLFELKRVVE